MDSNMQETQRLWREILLLRKLTQWNNIADKLPGDGEKVLIYFIQNEEITIASYKEKYDYEFEGKAWRFYDERSAIKIESAPYWMGLPDPPEILTEDQLRRDAMDMQDTDISR
jgi:hypothetical protein